eukprot:COSAG01_NODE_14158_length_1489_cov_1.774820_2_plen_48_part_00
MTNAQYASYLNVSGYVPKDGHNFLRHWGDTAAAARGTPGVSILCGPF